MYNGTYTNDVEKSYMYRLATDTTFGKEVVMLTPTNVDLKPLDQRFCTLFDLKIK